MHALQFRYRILLALSVASLGCGTGAGPRDLGSAVRVRASTLSGGSDGLHVEVLVDGLRSLELGYELCPELGLSAQANGIQMTEVGTVAIDPCGTWEFYIPAADIDAERLCV